MKNIFTMIALAVILLSCNNEAQEGRFTVEGEIKNIPDQKIYLEELYFSERAPAVLDTALIKNGKFTISASAPEEGLYRLRLEKNETGFIFINDKKLIPLTADYNKLSWDHIVFKSPANASLKSFITGINLRTKYLEDKTTSLQQAENSTGKDSIYNSLKKDMEEKTNEYKNYIIHYLDTTADPVMAAFALDYTRNIEPEKVEKSVAGLTARFPNSQLLSGMIVQYSQMIAQNKAKPKDGGVAPDINMPDTSGKSFGLSMLRGKYVLVDFWASWCGPCREENPNVVNAYNTFKDKNFTILGVSLDKDKSSWIKAIADDNLAWYHISDLKYWSSAAVSIYGFDGIPYNVLVDPQGKIVASNLRGVNLGTKLSELLK